MPDVQNQTASRPPWLPYRVKRPFSPGALARHVAALVAMVVASGLVAALMGIAILATVFLVTYPPLYRRYIAGTVALGVYSRVLVIDGVHLAWDLVSEIALTGREPDGRTEFAVRLRERGIRAVGLDRRSADAQGFHLRSSTTRAFSLDTLRAALRGSAPAHVTLTGF